MAATRRRDTSVTTLGLNGGWLPRRALDADLFDRLTVERLGAATDVARAGALGISRFTIRRMRKRMHAPSYATAARVAQVLEVPIDQLFPVQP